MKFPVNSLWKSAALALVLASLGPATLRAGTAETADSQAAKARLATLRARIAAVAGRLASDLVQRDAASARLRQVELDITAKRRELDAVRAVEAEVEGRRGRLRQERSRTEAALAAARSLLAAQVRGAYMIGRHEELKLMLNQSNPARVGRMATFYGYFGRARAVEITSITTQALRLQSQGEEIEAQSAHLRALAEDSRRGLADLLHARTERETLLAAFSKQVKSADQELISLKREEQALESLVADLESVLQDFPTDSQQSFGQMHGKLPWPVAGRIAAHFHDLRARDGQGGLRWNGVLIDGTRGEKVRAPYFGRVVYADWLQGLGLLLIISHNGGFLSLYGHAEVLYKSVGDWVAPGDVIASLGESGAGAPQLYFEIRQGRRPVDPKLWLK